MYRVKKWIFGIILIVFFSGCASYSTIELDVLKPADIEIPVEIASVVVVDNARPFISSDSAVHKIILPDRNYSIDTIRVEDFGKRVVESFSGTLESKQFFDSVHVAKGSFKNPARENLLSPLSSFEIDSLLRHYNAQAVISLDYFDYGTTLRITDTPDFYYSTLDARSNSYWRIHNGLTGEIMDVHFLRDTIFWEGAGASLMEVANKLPPIRKALEMAAQHAGEEYADYVAPGWKNEIRRYYTHGHPLFSRASELIAGGKWEEANRICYYVYENGSDKQRARAAFNLALGKEVLGEFREAAAWAYRSMEAYQELGALSVSQKEKDISVQYYTQLAVRIQEKKKLDEQYGIEE
ncbi:DUF6340 family protein [Anaerophaga thermohalophila]|uniref:DUF6340 family protein n=1 Tax=Anaerophaga thermohalophila TaxID=177400 RepID=UPI000237D1E4|nr:DUF6340 family protein [Anaerophaga thermohalophila]